MSSPVLMAPRVELSVRERLEASVAVAVAYFATKLKPYTLARFVRLLARGRSRPTYGQVLRMRDAVNSVSSRCAGNGCLQRSVAVMMLCRSRGLHAAWKCGFMTKPFVAHAWVEVSGVAVGETVDTSRYMITLSEGDES